MTTIIPRAPYSKDELKALYPDNLQLQLVQIVGLKLFLCLLVKAGKYS